MLLFFFFWCNLFVFSVISQLLCETLANSSMLSWENTWTTRICFISVNAISETFSFLLFDISLLPYPRITLTLLVTAFHSSFHYLSWPLNPSQCHCNLECGSSQKYDLHSYFPVPERIFGYITASVIQRIHILDQQLVPSLFNIPYIPKGHLSFFTSIQKSYLLCKHC